MVILCGEEVRLLTLEEKKALPVGQVVYLRALSGRLVAVRIEGLPEVRKGYPERTRVPWDYGHYEYGHFDENDDVYVPKSRLAIG